MKGLYYFTNHFLEPIDVSNNEITTLKSIAYADDLVIVSRISSIPALLDIISEWGEASGVRLNHSKCSAVVYSTQDTNEINCIRDLNWKIAIYEEDPEASIGNYLGIPISLSSKRTIDLWEQQTITKMQKTTTLVKRMKELTFTSVQDRAELFNIYVLSIPVYGARVLGLSKRFRKTTRSLN